MPKPKKKVDSENEDDYGDEEEGEDDEWDDECYICKKEGDLMCCETCSKVAHFSCCDLNRKPDDEWYCENCLHKQSRTRQTRSQKKR